jgi:protease-4
MMMDFEQNEGGMERAEPQYPESGRDFSAGQPPGTRSSKGSAWKVLLGILLAFSILANIVLFFLLIGVITFFGVGHRTLFAEEILREGPRTNKIAVVNIQGLIDGGQAQEFVEQLKMAKRDRRVKAVIVRVNSPGGTIAGSDQIYNEIRKFREEQDKPIVAFMQGIAASGGYYTSVACDRIVAEPTTITGSIGVMFGHFVLQQLLEEKLGIKPVIITAGQKKGWPSMFQDFTNEQREYVQDKLITPAYERFVQVVADGRSPLSLPDVRDLADGGIYGAQEALEKKLIDRTGYLDDAIEEVKSLANIKKAQVVEYRRPFSLARLLSYGSRGRFNIDTSTLYELSVPQVLYLWRLN